MTLITLHIEGIFNRHKNETSTDPVGWLGLMNGMWAKQMTYPSEGRIVPLCLFPKITVFLPTNIWMTIISLRLNRYVRLSATDFTDHLRNKTLTF